MTREQIEILIKDQDIWLESSPNYHHTVKGWVIDYDNDENYVVSEELYNILYSIFKEELSFNRDFDHDTFKTVLTNKLQFISPVKDQRLLFYHQQLTEQNNQLSEILSGNFYNTIPQLILSTFHLLLSENGMNWIECIKFTIHKGEKLATFNFGKIGQLRSPNFHYILEYFKSESMTQVYEIATIEENIKYLQTLIAEIEQPEELVLEQIDIALICILKKFDLYSLENCRQAMTKYNESLSLLQASKLRDKYKALYVKGDLIKTDFKKESQAEKVISSLKKITSFLNDVEIEVANNTIDTIEAKK